MGEVRGYIDLASGREGLKGRATDKAAGAGLMPALKRLIEAALAMLA